MRALLRVLASRQEMNRSDHGKFLHIGSRNVYRARMLRWIIFQCSAALAVALVSGSVTASCMSPTSIGCSGSYPYKPPIGTPCALSDRTLQKIPGHLPDGVSGVPSWPGGRYTTGSGKVCATIGWVESKAVACV